MGNGEIWPPLVLAAVLVGVLVVYLTYRRGGTSSRSELVALLRSEGITSDDVLAAIERVPRERFVPPADSDRAYVNRPLPIGEGQTISQPFIVAYMSELLEVEATDRVLEIGTGSGYQAAVLAELAATVYSIEILPNLGQRAEALLGELGYQNVEVRIGDGYAGWPEAAPFDAIILTAAPPAGVPEPLIAQLAVGGRLVAPVGDRSQVLVVIERTADGVTRQRDLPVRFVPMTGRAQER